MTDLACVIEAIRLLFTNGMLLSSIILTVWLPRNPLVSSLIYNVFGEGAMLAEIFPYR